MTNGLTEDEDLDDIDNIVIQSSEKRMERLHPSTFFGGLPNAGGEALLRALCRDFSSIFSLQRARLGRLVVANREGQRIAISAGRHRREERWIWGSGSCFESGVLCNLWVEGVEAMVVSGQEGEAKMDANVEVGERGGFSKHPARRKVIIDTDPGIDDMMAIFMAFQAPEIEVIGLTTIFGNVDTDLATINALHLCEMAGFPEVPVAEGPSESLKRVKPRIAYFVHGSDGLGETCQAKPKGQKSPKSAAEFLIEKVAEFPGEVTVVALGPLTNIALAIQKDPNFAMNIGQLVVLGGAFNASGNVNPAAEANVSLKRQKSHSRNIFGDPEAADVVFTAGLNTLVVGINLTTQVIFNEQDLCEIRDSGGKYGQYVYNCCRFYHDWHLASDHFDGIYLHDPTCMAALLDPTLFTFKKGAVRVETEGLCVGHTLLDMGLKNWVGNNPWTDVPPIDIGLTVDADGVRNLVKKLLCSS